MSLLMILLIAVPVAAGAVALYYFLGKSKSAEPPPASSSKESKEDKPAEKPIRARVADNLTGRLYNCDIPGQAVASIKEKHGFLGRQWNYNGEKLYYLNKTGEEEYAPIIPPFQLVNTPSELYNDTQHPDVAISYDMREEQPFMEKYGKILMWVAAIGFILFMWSQS